LFLRYLNYYLGDKVFWQGVKEYLENNKMSGVTTYDFRKALSNVSGFSLEALYHQFLEEPGHPELSVEESVSRGKVQVKITQSGRIFDLRVPARLYIADKSQELEIHIEDELTRLEFDRKDFKGFLWTPRIRFWERLRANARESLQDS